MFVLKRIGLILAATVSVIPRAGAQETILIEQRVAPEQTVGSLKQGMVCLPAGKIKAFQLRMPLPDTVSEAARQRSIWTSNQKLRGAMTKLDVSLCTSWKGIATTKPKGKLSVEISWSLATSVGSGAPCSTTTTVALDGHDPRISDEPMLSAIAASLTDAKQCLEQS